MNNILILFVLLCGGSHVDAQNLCLFNFNVDPSQITFTLYTQTNPTTGTLLTSTTYNQIKNTVRTIIIIHGWLQSGQQAWIIEMKGKYLVSDVNVIVVDWSKYSSCLDYSPSANAVQDVGIITGKFISDLVTGSHITLATTQGNGFSLGAHVLGVAGQEVFRISGDKIERINGLEATDFPFSTLDNAMRLDASDAKFLQAFHTSGYGMSEAYGTVDVYFNFNGIVCGRLQPNCPLKPGVPQGSNPLLPLVFCNHIRAVVYFSATIGNPTANLLAKFCSSCTEFGFNKCNGTTITVGENCPATATQGSYYLNTACNAPFGLGESGTSGFSNYIICLLG